MTCADDSAEAFELFGVFSPVLENDFKISPELSRSLIKTIVIIGHIHVSSAHEINLSDGVFVIRKAPCACI